MEKEVIIIGAGLTGLTLAHLLKKQNKDLLVIEQQKRAGGQIHTFKENGFIFESGPNTGVISYPEVAELFESLNQSHLLETAREESKCRLIWKKNSFKPLPSGLLSAISTPLFSWYDKFRILSEPFRKKGENPDESVGELTNRRLGKSFLKYAVDPFLSGVYAGDPMKLVTRHALPKLYRLEQTYGSFIKGTIAKAKEPKTTRDRLATKQVFSSEGGLSQLTEALSHSINKDQLILGSKEVCIRPKNDKWEVSFCTDKGFQTVISKCVVTTTGAYTLPDLLPFVDPNQIRLISNLYYAPIIQASVGIKNKGNMDFNAFGGLVPSCENKKVLGILFPSACFNGRTPENGALFSFFMGGVNHAEMLSWSDQQIKQIILEEWHQMLKFPTNMKPDMIRIFRHPRAIPQYEKSSEERFSAIKDIETSHKGLFLAGNIQGGIGMADRIRQAFELADKICKSN